MLIDEPEFEEGDAVDETTGDFIEIPTNVIEDMSENGLVIHRSLVILSKLMLFESVYRQCVPSIWDLCSASLVAAAGVIGNGELQSSATKDYCTIMRVVSFMDFREKNMDVLVMLSHIIQ